MAYRDFISLKLNSLPKHNNKHNNNGSYKESELLKKSNDNTIDFILYVMDISYFSGKMELYCRYKELNFMRVEPTFSELFDIAKEV